MLSHFYLNTFWVPALCYDNPLFLMGMLLLIYAFLIDIHLFRKTQGLGVLQLKLSRHLSTILQDLVTPFMFVNNV